MPDPRTYILELPAGTPILTGNNRMHRYARNKRNKELHKVAADLVMIHRLPPLGLCDVLVEYFSPPRLRKDRHPFASDAVLDSDAIDPTKKALIDGLVACGVWPSDQRKWIRNSVSRLSAEHHPRGLVRITITEVGEDSTS